MKARGRWLIQALTAALGMCLSCGATPALSAVAAYLTAPLAPTPVSPDALLRGTSLRASGRVACLPYVEQFSEKMTLQCEAFVIRSGFDGTATVEIPEENPAWRRILFVKGNSVASDSSDPLAFTGQGDLPVVKLGGDEHYGIPDALVTAG